jgi:hypothetical protein
MLPIRLAGVLSASASAALLVIVLVRDVRLNPLNGWTMLLGLVAAGLLLSGADGVGLFAACVILVLAMVPALIGGSGLLHVPSLGLNAVGALCRPSRKPAHRESLKVTG